MKIIKEWENVICKTVLEQRGSIDIWNKYDVPGTTYISCN